MIASCDARVSDLGGVRSDVYVGEMLAYV